MNNRVFVPFEINQNLIGKLVTEIKEQQNAYTLFHNVISKHMIEKSWIASAIRKSTTGKIDVSREIKGQTLNSNGLMTNYIALR